MQGGFLDNGALQAGHFRSDKSVLGLTLTYSICASGDASSAILLDLIKKVMPIQSKDKPTPRKILEKSISDQAKGLLVPKANIKKIILKINCGVPIKARINPLVLACCLLL